MEFKNLLIMYSGIRSNLNYAKNGGKELFFFIYDAYNKIHNNYVYNDEFVEPIERYRTGDFDLPEAISAIDKTVFNFIAEKEIKDWKYISTYLGGYCIFNVFNYFHERISDEDYWYMVSRCYTSTSFSSMDYEFIYKFLNSKRKKREYMMIEDERLFLKNLPEQVEVYRGCSKNEIKSKKFRFSWTLSEEVAKYFAFKYKNYNKDNDVIKKVVSKSKIIAYLNEREEQEVIILDI